LKYEKLHSKSLQRLRKAEGVEVAFVSGGEAVYDPEMDEYTETPEGSSVVGLAVELPGNPEEYAALDLLLYRPITLFFVPYTHGEAPGHASHVFWAGKDRAIKQSFPVRPDGVYIGARLILV
jgi:hypothetical protein